jgi:hypothetical protein
VNEKQNLNNLQCDNEVNMSSMLDREGLKIIKNLRGDINSDNLYKFKDYLINQHKKFELQNMSSVAQSDYFTKSGIIRSYTIVKDHVFKNLNEPSLYSLISTFKDFLINLKIEEKLKMIFDLDSSKINVMINILDDTMENIIHKQIKMKNSRRNLKTKLRLQRRLNEIKSEIEKINS